MLGVSLLLTALTAFGTAKFWYHIPRSWRKVITYPPMAWLLDLVLNLGIPGAMLLLTGSIAGAIASSFTGLVLDVVVHIDRKGFHFLGLKYPGLHEDYYERARRRKEFLERLHQ